MSDIIDIINNMKNITENDKKILKEVNLNFYAQLPLLEQLSFYSAKFKSHNMDDYSYLQTQYNETIYGINTLGGLNNILFDSDKKLIFNTRYWYNSSSIHLIQHLAHFFNNIFNTLDDKIKNSYDIGDNIILIQSWFTTYGHFLDEVYNLHDFRIKLQNFKNEEYKVLNSYPNSKEDYFKNYDVIVSALFPNSEYINYNKYDNIVRMKNCFIIQHKCGTPTFHNFPANTTKYLLDNISFNPTDYNHKNIFITRGIATHLPRNLENQIEIENYFTNYDNFKVINPETMHFNEFVNNIRKVNLLVITWGGALTNLVFLPANANVIILKSKSYDNESIHLFNKIIKRNNLNVIIIESIDNVIKIDTIETILQGINQ